MNEITVPRKRRWIAIALTGAVLLLAGLAIALWRKRRQDSASGKVRTWQDISADLSKIQGLSEAEAEARRLEVEESAAEFGTGAATKDIWRRNLLSIFNLNLIGLSVALLLLGKPLDALTSAAGAFISIVMNVRQQMIADKQLAQVAASTRPEAIVVREGKVRTIGPREVVRGDVLLVGPGDEIFADGQVMGKGQIIVDESALAGETKRVTKSAKDAVYAGSFCIEGRTTYEAQKVGRERMVETLTASDEEKGADLTPLQSTMNRILRILLVIVAAFVVGFLSVVFPERWRRDSQFLPGCHFDGVWHRSERPVFHVHHHLRRGHDQHRQNRCHHSPATGDRGVGQRDRDLFWTRPAVLTGVGVQLDALDLSELDESMTQRRVRRALGDFAHSTSSSSSVSRAIADEFSGERRPVLEEAPFFSAYGWSAVAFDEQDLSGVFVLGDPEILGPNLVKDLDDIGSADQPTYVPPGEQALRGFVGRLAAKLRRDEQDADVPLEQDVEQIDADGSVVQARGPADDEPQDTPATSQSSEELAPAEDEGKRSLFKGVFHRAKTILSRSEEGTEDQATEEAEEEQERELLRLLFAYLPQVAPLRAADGSPQLPSKLIPLCTLRLVEQVREEAIATIQTFAKEGVDIKILSSDPPKAVAKTAAQLGLAPGDASQVTVISGQDLAAMEAPEFAETVAEQALFGDVRPEQAALIVQALQDQGEHVAVVGNRVSHLPALRKANLKITIQSASDAVLATADLVLLNDSLGTLSQVLNSGQRIVNSLLDMLKLNMTQVIYLTAFLTMTIFIGFPYAPQHGSFISLFTLSLPATGLTLWAATGASRRHDAVTGCDTLCIRRPLLWSLPGWECISCSARTRETWPMPN